MDPVNVGNDVEIALPRHMIHFNMHGKRVIFKSKNYGGGDADGEQLIYKYQFNPKDVDNLCPKLFQLMYASRLGSRKLFYSFWVRNEVCRIYMDVNKFSMSLKDPVSGEWVVRVSSRFSAVSHEGLEGRIRECTAYQPDKTRVYVRLVTTRAKINAPDDDSDDSGSGSREN